MTPIPPATARPVSATGRAATRPPAFRVVTARLLPAGAALAATVAPAAAHVGHLGQVSGHDHWTIGVGLGVIAGAAAAGWLKGRRDRDKARETAEPGAEEQAA